MEVRNLSQLKNLEQYEGCICLEKDFNFPLQSVNFGGTKMLFFNKYFNRPLQNINFSNIFKIEFDIS